MEDGLVGDGIVWFGGIGEMVGAKGQQGDLLDLHFFFIVLFLFQKRLGLQHSRVWSKSDFSLFILFNRWVSIWSVSWHCSVVSAHGDDRWMVLGSLTLKAGGGDIASGEFLEKA